MFQFFERLIQAYPSLQKGQAQAEIPPKNFWRFVAYSTHGVRGTFAFLVFLTAATSALEAMLFAFLGQIIDWLATVPPAQLWSQEKARILGIVAAIVPLLVAYGVITAEQGTLWEALAGAVVSKPMAKKTTSLSGLAWAILTASRGE